MPDGGPRRVVILTAIPVEYEAVRSHLTNLHGDKQGRVHYQRGIFSTTNQVWEVVIRQTGPGNVRAAVETLLAIHYFDPALILFIGVAGGLKDVNLGDVVVPTKVYAYESGRANVTTFQTRPQVVTPTFPLLELAQAEAKEQDWLKRLKEPIPETLPHVHAAPITSGESVIASTRSAIYKFLRTSYSDAIAVEMESFGFLLAAYFHPEVDTLVIRGISDLINSKKRADRNKFQELAARCASAFAFEILAKIDVADLHQSRRRAEMPAEPIVRTGHITVDVPGPVAPVQHEFAIPDHETVAPHEPVATTQYESQVASTEGIHPQQFLKLVQQLESEIRDVHKLFGESRTTFYDNCKRAIKLMKRLEGVIKEYYKHVTHPNRSIKFTVDKINDQIRDLLSELGDFPRIHSTEQRRHDYITLQKDIRHKFELLLEKLEQLEELEQMGDES